MRGTSITGRKENIDYDFYETPKWAAEKAIREMLRDGVMNKKENVYEPCAGAGAITDVLEMLGFEHIRASDIQTADYIKGVKGVDVYEVEDNACDVVITNPPYNLMTKGNMLNEFLRISKRKVILLLNIFFLSSKERKRVLENSSLRHIYIHSHRVTMCPYGQIRPQNSGTKMYAWYVWDKEYKGKPTLSWI
ncbi:MAG: class I SAM-dependent methyltransferase [Clostridium sp.]|nr:class I SAM-dependent methyltransferase [Clostridium sp.]